MKWDEPGLEPLLPFICAAGSTPPPSCNGCQVACYHGGMYPAEY